jgi:hypothetical protein
MRIRRLRTLSVLSIAASGFLCVAAPPAKTPDTFAVKLKPFLTKNCYACHSAAVKTADVNLERYQKDADILADSATWDKVVEMLKTKQMPPKGIPRPADADVSAAVSYVEGTFERAEMAAPPNPGRVTARRLNRTEYNNTVRDLLGVTLRPADDFPEDDSGYGFDNIGDVLSLSPVLMEKYLASAEKISRAALFGPDQLKPAGERFQPPGRRGQQPKSATDYDETGLSLGSALHVNYHFPTDGEYVFRATCDGRRPGVGGADMAFWLDGKLLGVKHIESNDLEGQTREVRVPVTTGDHLVSATFYKVFERLPASFGGLNPLEPPAGAGGRGGRGGGRGGANAPAAPMPPPNLTPEELAQFQQRQQARLQAAAPQRGPGGGLQPPPGKVDFLFIWGPFDQPKGPSPESVKKIFTCGSPDAELTPACQRKIISDLAGRAYRRPSTAAEVDKLVHLMDAAENRGNSVKDSLALSIQAMLVNPNFLFRIEREPATPSAANYRVSQYELASRLSYFLWASMPDAELLRCASQQTLRNPAVLSAQVTRMLKDPKAHALVEDFAGQWLETRALESVKPDARKFGEFDDYLRLLMRTETETFFESVMREDHSVIDLLNGKYTFLNQRLAEFYGIPGVKGQEFRKVDLTGTPRGGVWTQASVLTVSSYATRTSPVLRGKWILENILNTPPPPPPPNVPTLDDSKVGQSVSLRQQLEAHRKDAVCASCHSRMDPLGLGLENFDAIGAWRAKDGQIAIDASGTLPDGRTFTGPDGLREVLTAQKDMFAECVVDKMLTYALGRGLERYDRRTVREIAKKAAVSNYKFSSVVLEIVKSLPFEMRQGDSKQADNKQGLQARLAE